MAADAAFVPVDALLARKLCAGPRCTTEFTPGKLSDPYCSERCAAAGAAAGVQVITGERCALPGCQKQARPGFPHCSRDCAEVAAQARAAAAAGAGPTQLAQVLGLPTPAPDDADVDEADPEVPDAPDVQDLVELEVPAPGKVCAYGPCDLAPMLAGQHHGWQAAYCGWPHVLAAKADREAGNGQAPAKVHTPDPTDGPVGVAAMVQRPTAEQGTGAGLEAAPSRTPPVDDPGLITTRTVQLSGGGWVSLTLAVDLFELSSWDRGFVLALVDRVNNHLAAEGAPL